MSRGSCFPPSTTSRRSTSSASSRRTSAAASARRSTSIRKRSSACGRRRSRACRSSGWPSAPNPSSPTRMAATTSPMRRWRSTPTTRSSGCKVDTIANFGGYMSLFSSCVPTYLYATLLVRPVRDPGDPRQRARGLHQHLAGRRLSRRRAAGGDLSARAHRGDGGARARRFAGGASPQELHHGVPATRRRSSWPTTPAATRPRSTPR